MNEIKQVYFLTADKSVVLEKHAGCHINAFYGKKIKLEIHWYTGVIM